MAGLACILQSSEITTGTTKKTVLQVLSPTNQKLKIKEIEFSFQGATNTHNPVRCSAEIQSSAGSSGDVKNPGKENQSDGESIQSSGLENIDGSTQPTVVETLKSLFVHPQGGYTWQPPYGTEWKVKGGQRLGLTVEADNSVVMLASIRYEE